MRKTGFLARLARNQRGAVAPLFIGTLGIVVATSLGGIDLARYSIAQNRLQNALDSATLSAGRNLADLSSVPTVPELGTWQEDAYAFFRANMPDGYLGSTIAPEDLHIEYEEELSHGYTIGQIIRMDASGTLPLISTGYLSVASMGLAANNEAIRRTRSDLEVVMALDNTGSMDAEGRMTTLKSAARDLTETVLGASRASGVEGRVFVGLVPFAETVNVGVNPNTRAWLQRWASGRSDRQHFVNNLWKGCISEPYWVPNAKGKLPAVPWSPTAAFQPLALVPQTAITRSDLGLATSGSTYERPIASTGNQPQPVSITTPHREIKAISAPRNTNSTSRTGTLEYYTLYSWANPDHCRTERASLFLTDNEAALNSAINSMYSDGGTIIPTGLLWAWRMLRPDWRGTPGWGDPDKPREPEPKVLSKVIVLLTDGDNDASKPPNYGSNVPHQTERRLSNFSIVYDAQRCTNSSFNKNCSTVRKTANISNKAVNSSAQSYQHPVNSLRVRDTDDTSTTTQLSTIGYNQNQIEPVAMDGYLSDLCTAIKDDGNGIKIYTVTLGRSVSAATKRLMENCSSGINYAYISDSVNDLPMVFKSIAGALTELRLIK
ncbi:MAG: pilus assembly protein TadG-related protein [Castellaniella sp.]